ncbi:uncharacterized protein [Cherax quadricarinatus]|uniref:uncharacterized protein isoform X1 n=2 Tax=Cherax quadricarinatus TaxID=27406 RepID=UPI00387EB823
MNSHPKEGTNPQRQEQSPKGMMAWCLMVIVATSMITEATSNMEDTIKDIYEESPKGQQGRFFMNYDQSIAFNTSVAFTLPLFTFILPGAADFAAAGYNSQSFGALTFIALFLLGMLGLSIYTISQEDIARESSGGLDFQESVWNNLVTESLSFLPSMMDMKSCSRLAICSAHEDSARYGFLAWPVRVLMPSPSHDVPEEELTECQQAARYGKEGEEECHYKYPCLVNPLDLILLIYDYWYGDE